MRKALSNIAYAYEKCLEEAGYVPSIQPPLMEAKEALTAPDPLLEILKSLLTDCEMTALKRGYHPEDFDNIRQARAAIAKAEADAKYYT